MLNTNIEAAIHKLGDIFDCFNKRFFDDKMPRPIFMIGPAANKWEASSFALRAYISPADMSTNNMERARAEFYIGVEEFCKSWEDVAATVLHQMVHYDNALKGIKDTSKKIHNKKFSVAAEKVWLHVEKVKGLGFGYTTATEQLKTWLHNVVSYNDQFALIRLTPTEEKKARKRTGKYKYTNPDNATQTFKCKFDVLVTEPKTSVVFTQEWEEPETDE